MITDNGKIGNRLDHGGVGPPFLFVDQLSLPTAEVISGQGSLSGLLFMGLVPCRWYASAAQRKDLRL